MRKPGTLQGSESIDFIFWLIFNFRILTPGPLLLIYPPSTQSLVLFLHLQVEDSTAKLYAWKCVCTLSPINLPFCEITMMFWINLVIVLNLPWWKNPVRETTGKLSTELEDGQTVLFKENEQENFA